MKYSLHMSSPPSEEDFERRFWLKVDSVDDCWIWVGAKSKRGYGNMRWIDGRTWAAYRIAYEMLIGPIPPGLDLDHLCSNPSCVNPGHLEPVTHAENLRRGGEHELEEKHKTLDHNYVKGTGYRRTGCDICYKRYRSEYDKKRALDGYWKMAPEDIQPRIYKSKTGHTGISAISRGKKYQAYVDKGGKRVYLGVYATIEDAIKARDEYMVNMQI